MTRAEEKAFHRGKHAAFVDARKRNPGEKSRCEFRNARQRQRWHEGYAEQASTHGSLTPEQEENRRGLREAIQGWLVRNK